MLANLYLNLKIKIFVKFMLINIIKTTFHFQICHQTNWKISNIKCNLLAPTWLIISRMYINNRQTITIDRCWFSWKIQTHTENDFNISIPFFFWHAIWPSFTISICCRSVQQFFKYFQIYFNSRLWCRFGNDTKTPTFNMFYPRRYYLVPYLFLSQFWIDFSLSICLCIACTNIYK